ncbi:MAG: STAS domain-containing protein [Eubacteriales bacterium]|nr:STAS domain-containing protein [Eubacteriales bacterium]
MFSYEVKENGADVFVDLKGKLDGVAAPQFHEGMSKIIGEKITSLTFNAKELDYISSAGLRVIVFVKQKLGPDVHLYLKDATDAVKSIMEMTGFSDFVEMV